MWGPDPPPSLLPPCTLNTPWLPSPPPPDPSPPSCWANAGSTSREGEVGTVGFPSLIFHNWGHGPDRRQAASPGPGAPSHFQGGGGLSGGPSPFFPPPLQSKGLWNLTVLSPNPALPLPGYIHPRCHDPNLRAFGRIPPSPSRAGHKLRCLRHLVQ